MEIESLSHSCRCIVCGENSFSCLMYVTGYVTDDVMFEINPKKFFSREYKCPICRTEISLYTIVDTLNINELLRKDAEWLESLK
jgi:hypothetical protein